MDLKQADILCTLINDTRSRLSNPTPALVFEICRARLLNHLQPRIAGVVTDL